MDLIPRLLLLLFGVFCASTLWEVMNVDGTEMSNVNMIQIDKILFIIASLVELTYIYVTSLSIADFADRC